MEIQRIKSFEIDHTILDPGFYISRVDGDITTFDLRTRKPNTDSLITPSTMHTLEHMFATFIRNSSIAENVVYFGPMGCQTGFYLLTRNVDAKEVFEQTKLVLEKIMAYEGPVFGCSPIECGNYKTLNLQTAKDDMRHVWLYSRDKYLPLEQKDTRQLTPMRKVACDGIRD